jgi:hypothetical protein
MRFSYGGSQLGVGGALIFHGGDNAPDVAGIAGRMVGGVEFIETGCVGLV